MNLKLEGLGMPPDAADALRRAFTQDRMPHALLLEASPARAKAVAQRLAQAAVCLSEEERPCGVCTECVRAQAGSHPDILTLDGDEDPRAFPVDAVRAVRAAAYVKPNEARCKVFVLLGVQNMSEISQNALLKILEEPPENVLFLLTASSAAALLPTVLSRVQTVSPGDEALSGDWGRAEEIARAVSASGEAELLFLTADGVKDRAQLKSWMRQFLFLLRDALARRSGGEACLSGRREAAEALGGSLTRQSLTAMIDRTEEALAALERNANTALLVTWWCAHLRAAAGR